MGRLIHILGALLSFFIVFFIYTWKEATFEVSVEKGLISMVVYLTIWAVDSAVTCIRRLTED